MYICSEINARNNVYQKYTNMNNHSNLSKENLTISPEKREKKSANLRKPRKKTNDRFTEFDLWVKEGREQMKEIRQQMKETDLRMKETDRQMKETDLQMKETDRKIAETNRQIGGITNSNGEVAESYFINSFEQNPHFAGQDFDSLASNLLKSNPKLNLRDEYDLVLYNCTSVAIIEIKYKARKEDIIQLLRKAQTFKQLFPEYAHYAIYLGLAGLHVNITAEREALEQGIAIIKQVGKNMIINDTHLKVF
jgi:hypothetical protein